MAEEDAKDCYPITSSDLFREDAPQFNQYPAKVEQIKTRAKVNLKSHPKARMYRTMLRNGSSKGPNFAGHYAVVGWGCGSSCFDFGVVDLQSGVVIFPTDFEGVLGMYFCTDGFMKDGWNKQGEALRYRLDSRLLVVLGGLFNNEAKVGAFYYLLKDGKLKRIYEVTADKKYCDDVPFPQKCKDEAKQYTDWCNEVGCE